MFDSCRRQVRLSLMAKIPACRAVRCEFESRSRRGKAERGRSVGSYPEGVSSILTFAFYLVSSIGRAAAF